MSGSDIKTDSEPRVEPAFKVGDVVIYTNPQGVCFGKRTIVGTGPEFNDEAAARGAVRYYIEPTDTPWYPVRESCLSLPR